MRTARVETTWRRSVAEHLGARFEDIRIVQATARPAGGTGTYARPLDRAGVGAATLAAEAVREKVLNVARIYSKPRPTI